MRPTAIATSIGASLHRRDTNMPRWMARDDVIVIDGMVIGAAV